MISVLACVASVVLSGHICDTGNGQPPCIDIKLTGPPNARVDDIINMDISIVAQQDDDATPGNWVGVEVVLNWDPAVLEPVGHSICESLFDYFLVMLFVSDDPANLYYGCINQDFDGDGWPDNDGDLSVLFFSPLGSSQDIFAIPMVLGTMEFRVLAEGDHTVSIAPSTDCWFPDDPKAVFPIETQVLRGGNIDVTGDLTDTYTVEVRNAFDTEDPPGIGIEDFLAFLAAWAAQEGP